MEHITVKLNLSPKQLKQLSKGVVTGIKHHQIGSGMNIKMSRENAKKTLLGLRNNKGFRIKLEEHELNGSGINFKKLGKQAKSALKATANDVRQAVEPILRDRANLAISQLSGSGVNFKKFGKQAKNALQATAKDVRQAVAPMLRERANQALNEKLLSPQMQNSLQQMGIKNMVYDLGSAVKPIASNTINGQGVFGKRVDNFLKKKGIKNEVYKVGSAFKPLVHQAINAVGAAGQAYGIPTGAATAFANRYIDHPDETQAAVRAMVGNGIHKPRLIMRSDSSNIINSENANFYPPNMPTFKQRQMGMSGGSFKN
jgi:hypothetical protein